MTQEIATELLRSGLLGVLCLAEGLVIVRLWRQLSDEHNARILEAKETTKQLLAVAEKVNEAITKLHEIGEWLEAKKPETKMKPQARF